MRIIAGTGLEIGNERLQVIAIFSASFELGDVAQMVAEENRNFVSGKPGDERILRETLRSLLMSPELRKQLGSANRARAVSNYDETLMIERYARLFG